MYTDHTLLEHAAACELTYQTLLEENRLLKATNAPPPEDFLRRKHHVLAQLDSALSALRRISASQPKFSAEQRAVISRTQQLIMKTLLLDRENEQLLHKCAVEERRSANLKARPSLQQIRRIYGKHTAGFSAEG
jgi:hypothetical protein